MEMVNDYVALALIAALSITGGLSVLYQAKKYRRKRKSKSKKLMELLERPAQPNEGLRDLFSRKAPWDSSWLADQVDKAIENSKRMEHDLEYRSEIQKRTR